MFQAVFLNFISYLFLIKYNCIDFKSSQYPCHRCYSIRMINFLKRSTKFPYDAKYSTSIIVLRHKRMIIEFRIGATIRSVVVRIEN